MRTFLQLMSYFLFFVFPFQLYGNSFSSYEIDTQETVSAQELMKRTSSMLTRAEKMRETVSALDCKSMVETLGIVVEKLNTLQVGTQEFTLVRGLASRLSDLCRQRVRTLENGLGDDEKGLEEFYTSEDWYTFNYVFSAVKYWQAWIDFGIARVAIDESELIGALSSAERGFQIAAMRIHYPSIVYGSWWGLVNIALQRDEIDKAEQRLNLLKQAIDNGNQPELEKIVNNQLAILKIKNGEVLTNLETVGETVNDNTAQILIEEAFVLLEKHRREQTQTVAIDAAKRLRKVLAAGYYDDVLLSRLMAYKKELAGSKIGVLGLLIEAEYGYAYEKYNTVVLKYRQFKRQRGDSLGLNTDLYQYHYALSLFKVDLATDALAEVKALLRKGINNPDLRFSASKLYFSIAAHVDNARLNQAGQNDYVLSARNLVESTPQNYKEDPVLGLAWSVLGQFEEDAVKSNEYFKQASNYPASAKSVYFSQYQKLIKQFEQAYQEGNSGQQRVLAEKGHALYLKLSAKTKKVMLVKAYDLLFTSVLATDVNKVLPDIDKHWEKNKQNETVLRVLFRTKLLLSEKSEVSEHLSSYITDIIEKDLTNWQLEGLFNLVLIKERAGSDVYNVAKLASILIPKFTAQPVSHRYLLSLRTRMLMDTGDLDKAFWSANEFVSQYPKSGDAWKVYAAAAERSENFVEADHAWAKIARSEPKGSPLWLESALKRTALNSTRDINKACDLLMSIKPYIDVMNSKTLTVFNTWMGNLNCQTQSVGSV